MKFFLVAAIVTLVLVQVSIAKKCKCGNVLGKRAVNVGLNKFPWQAVVKYQNVDRCVGALVKNTVVITSAQCVFGTDVTAITVVLGREGNSDANAIVAPVRRIKVHNSYQKNLGHKNLAMLKLDVVVPSSEDIMPICLPFNHQGDMKAKDIVTVLGFGKDVVENEVNAIRRVDLSYLPYPKCQKDNIVGNYVTSKMICAKNATESVCYGDHGDPLFWQHPVSNRFYLYGISLGNYCQDAGVPSIFARMNRHLRWIEKVMKGRVCKVDRADEVIVE